MVGKLKVGWEMARAVGSHAAQFHSTGPNLQGGQSMPLNLTGGETKLTHSLGIPTSCVIS
jgi:hypothetical protein